MPTQKYRIDTDQGSYDIEVEDSGSTPSVEPKGATMKAITADDTAPVTLGDLFANPGLAVQRMASLAKKDLTNPALMIPLAVGLGAKATGIGTARPAAGPGTPAGWKPPTTAQAGGAGGAVVDAALEMMPWYVRAAGKFARGRMGQTAATPAPVSAGPVPPVNAPITAAPVAAAPPSVSAAPMTRRMEAQTGQYRYAEGPPAPVAAPPGPPRAAPATAVGRAVPPQTPPATVPASAAPPARASAPSATAKTSPAKVKAAQALLKTEMTPAEIKQVTKWADQGIDPAVILQRLTQSRQLTQRIKSIGPDAMEEAVRLRNKTGRWPSE